jgi:hypothetical protein
MAMPCIYLTKLGLPTNSTGMNSATFPSFNLKGCIDQLPTHRNKSPQQDQRETLITNHDLHQATKVNPVGLDRQKHRRLLGFYCCAWGNDLQAGEQRVEAAAGSEW